MFGIMHSDGIAQDSAFEKRVVIQSLIANKGHLQKEFIWTRIHVHIRYCKHGFMVIRSEAIEVIGADVSSR